VSARAASQPRNRQQGSGLLRCARQLRGPRTGRGSAPAAEVLRTPPGRAQPAVVGARRRAGKALEARTPPQPRSLDVIRERLEISGNLLGWYSRLTSVRDTPRPRPVVMLTDPGGRSTACRGRGSWGGTSWGAQLPPARQCPCDDMTRRWTPVDRAAPSFVSTRCNPGVGTQRCLLHGLQANPSHQGIALHASATCIPTNQHMHACAHACMHAHIHTHTRARMHTRARRAFVRT
jgi:hypothetical protein